jgi:chaperonin GroEL
MKQIYIENSPFRKMFEGVQKLAKVVAETLGPNGKNILIDRGDRPPMSTRDGVTVAKSINLSDRLENFGASLVKEAAHNTNTEAGDGTTTSTVIAHAILKEGLKYVASGINPINIKRSIDETVDKVIAFIKDHAKQISTKEDIINVAKISTNNDEKLGTLIAEAAYKVGTHGTILVENSQSDETYLKFQEGMVIERGVNDTSPLFVTDPVKRTAEYDNPKILVIDDKIHDIQQILAPVEYCFKNSLPLVIMVRDIEDTVLGALVANKLKKGLRVAVLRNIANVYEILEDYAIYLGAKIFNPDWKPLSSFSPDDFGSCKKIVIGMLETTIIEGCGNIYERLFSIKKMAEDEERETYKTRIMSRYNKLTNSVASIYVAGQSDTELVDAKLRVEDAIHACKSAMKEGIIAGGGVVLLHASNDLKEDTVGDKILKVALQSPIRGIIENSGENPDKIIYEIERSKSKCYGYNAYTKKMCQLFDAGIIDPCLVTRVALQKAASVAGMLLTTGSCVVRYEDNDK